MATLKYDLSKNGKVNFYSLLTAEYGKGTVSDALVTVSAPTADTATQAGANTKVTLTAVAGNGTFKGDPIDRFYTRPDVSDVLTAIGKSGDDLKVQGDVAAWKADGAAALAAINAVLGTVFVDGEITKANGADSTDGNGKAVYTVEVGVVSTHLGLTGHLVFVVTDNVDHTEDMASAFPNNKMDGFDTPAAS